MNAITRAGLLSLVLVSGCKPTVILEAPEPEPTPTDADSDPLVEYEAIRESVRHYAAALSAHDPKAASEWVVSDTFGYYEDLRVAALRATREQLEAWDLMSVMLILQIRTQITREQLESLDGLGLFERAVTAGLVGEQIEDIVLDDVWLDDTGEHAQIRLDGEPVVWLRKEQREGDGEHGRWRVDIPEMIRLLGPAIEAMAHDAVSADGKVRTALTFVELSTEAFVDIAVLDGPLDATD
ncbi:hypothetical protein DB30_07571 [Enhygromyxa salina]|uniref:Lipoprotein n=1 Tax=Enhygromyxa salina TaxID=215803 RepID=A0A0C2CVU7_9BACT|nr:hypothetical protein [Enhygromyxa salina]KIG13725.1 hypothetical protein DB30_07571 [Enhygromyxa salina]